MRPILMAVPIAFLAACGGADSSTRSTQPSIKLALAITVMTGTGQHGQAGQELPAAIAVKVINRADSTGGAPVPVADQLVNWVVVSGGGSVFAPVTTTNADGVAYQRWTLGLDGPQTLEARAIDPKTGEKITYATITAIIDPPPPPVVGSITVAPHQQIAWLGNPAPLTVTVTDSEGNPAPIPYTIVSRNPDIAALPKDGSGPYGGLQTGTSWFVASAGDKSDSSQITVIPYDTARTYRASAYQAYFQTMSDTVKSWGADSAVRVIVMQTFPDSGPYDGRHVLICKATYTITVSSGELGTPHPTTTPNSVYPGCDPYALYSVTWKIRAKDSPSTPPSFQITVCPDVPHPVCATGKEVLP